MSIPLTHAGLSQFLNEKQFTLQKDAETNQFSSSLPIGGQDYPLFFKLDTENGTLQLILFIPFAIETKSLNALARLLHLFNKQIDLPGFGMDESAKAIFYRVTIPAINGQVYASFLESILEALPKIGYAFFPTIASVASGKISFENIQKRLDKQTS